MLHCKLDNGCILKSIKIMNNFDIERGLLFEEVFDKTLMVRPKNPRFSRLFSDGTYSALKENAVKADPKLLYYLWEMESRWKSFEDLGQYFGKQPMYFEETKK